MTKPFSYEDTQFVADTINRETVERAHAILTGLIERGWKPPLATGGLVDSSNVYRVGEDRDCGYLTPEKLRAARERLLDGADPRLIEATGPSGITVHFEPGIPTDAIYAMGTCGCGHSATSHTREGCQVVTGFAGPQCPCTTDVANLAAKVTGVGTEDTTP